jgi:hypothetical protein
MGDSLADCPPPGPRRFSFAKKNSEPLPTFLADLEGPRSISASPKDLKYPPYVSGGLPLDREGLASPKYTAALPTFLGGPGRSAVQKGFAKTLSRADLRGPLLPSNQLTRGGTRGVGYLVASQHARNLVYFFIL